MATHNRPTRAKLAETVNNTWRFNNEFAVDTTIDELLDKETWAHVASSFTQGDEIIVVPQGMPFRAHLIVVDAGKIYAKVRLISVTPLNAVPAPVALPVDALPASAVLCQPGGVTFLPDEPAVEVPMFVKWNPGSKKYSIYRTSDKEKVHDGFAVKADAEAWAVQHTLAMAA